MKSPIRRTAWSILRNSSGTSSRDWSRLQSRTTSRRRESSLPRTRRSTRMPPGSRASWAPRRASTRTDLRGMPRKWVLSALVIFVALFGSASAGVQQRPTGFRVLVFTKTDGFRHSSIPSAIQALGELGAQNGFAVDATEEQGAFTDANLARYAVVAFVLTAGDVLDNARQAAFERYIRSGHGFVGVHSATDSERDWAWYRSLVGASFKSHPAIQTATLDVADPRHLSTAGLPRRWVREDEWYNFVA